MNRDDPSTWSNLALWEYGRKRFGYGDWNEDHPEPYNKWAGMEAHKLAMSMRRKRITAQEFCWCVDYCARHRMHIPNATWVLSRIDEAIREHRQLERESKIAALDLDAETSSAIAYERALADQMSEQWITQLSRAHGDARAEVVKSWRAHRSLPSPIS